MTTGTADTAETGRPAARGTPARGALRTVATLGATVVAVVVIWTVFIDVVPVSPFVAKSPLDVWDYLVTAPAAGGHRIEIAGNLLTTLTDAALGFVLGLVLAAGVCSLFYFSRTAAGMFVPAVSAVHAVPMVTVAPILVLVFGRGPGGVAVIGAAIVFVPAVLTMLQGVRACPRTDLDMCAAYGGTTRSAFTKVALPHALPTWFTAARVAVTSSIVGSLLAEWLATGTGLGGQMLRDANEFQFARLWSSVVVLTVVCVAVYHLVSLLETAVTTRLNPTR